MSHSNMKDQRIGEQRINKNGLKMVVIDYINSHNIIVQFDDGTTVKTEWREFNCGVTQNPNSLNYYTNRKPKIQRVGEENINNQGSLMKIIAYNGANDIIVQFDNNPSHIKKTFYRHFKLGITQNPYLPSVYGVGITGQEAPCMDGSTKLKEYRTWTKMIERCYDKKNQTKSKNITYIDCIVSDDFLYYPNFYNWIICEENYEIWKNTANFAIDKDIIQKGNKVYSPEKCCLVPNSINNLIQNDAKRRGKYAIGVTEDPHHSNLLIAQCWNGLLQKNIHLGTFNNELDAFMVYKEYKEKLIKQTADEAYGNKLISKKCWEALYNYTIDITD